MDPARQRGERRLRVNAMKIYIYPLIPAQAGIQRSVDAYAPFNADIGYGKVRP